MVALVLPNIERIFQVNVTLSLPCIGRKHNLAQYSKVEVHLYTTSPHQTPSQACIALEL